MNETQVETCVYMLEWMANCFSRTEPLSTFSMVLDRDVTDQTLIDSADLLSELGLFNKTVRNNSVYNYKGTRDLSDIKSVFLRNRINEFTFKKVFVQFVSLGDFEGYITEHENEGFCVDSRWKRLFENFCKLENCSQSNDLFYWTAQSRPILIQLYCWREESLIELATREIQKLSPGASTLIQNLSQANKNHIKKHFAKSKFLKHYGYEGEHRSKSDFFNSRVRKGHGPDRLKNYRIQKWNYLMARTVFIVDVGSKDPQLVEVALQEILYPNIWGMKPLVWK